MLLPAAVVAPIFFKGEIGFGVVTQSQSAFSHILSDISLVVYQVSLFTKRRYHCVQFEALAGFSAVIDRLGEFREAVNEFSDQNETQTNDQIQIMTKDPPQSLEDPLLEVEHLTLFTPNSSSVLIDDLSFKVFTCFK